MPSITESAVLDALYSQPQNYLTKKKRLNAQPTKKQPAKKKKEPIKMQSMTRENIKVRVKNMATQPLKMEEPIESDDEIDLEQMREQIDFIINPSDSDEDDRYLEQKDDLIEIDNNILEERSQVDSEQVKFTKFKEKPMIFSQQVAPLSKKFDLNKIQSQQAFPFASSARNSLLP